MGRSVVRPLGPRDLTWLPCDPSGAVFIGPRGRRARRLPMQPEDGFGGRFGDPDCSVEAGSFANHSDNCGWFMGGGALICCSSTSSRCLSVACHLWLLEVSIVSTHRDRPGLVENIALGRRAINRTAILRTVVITVVLAAIAYLLTRHAVHALQYLPLLVLLACPLMHIFMHRGHRH